MREIRVPADGWGRAGLPVMPCGHPLAARAVRSLAASPFADLFTDCWACGVERELIRDIVGPAKRASIAAKRSVE